MRKELDKILTEATKDKHKEIAFDLDSCANTVRRECNGSVKFNMLEKVNIFMSAEDGDTIINKLASMQGGLFFRDIVRINNSDFTIIPSLLKEFSELMNVLAESLLDGQITDSEYNNLKKEWSDCTAIVQSLFSAIERGDFSRKMIGKN